MTPTNDSVPASARLRPAFSGASARRARTFTVEPASLFTARGWHFSCSGGRRDAVPACSPVRHTETCHDETLLAEPAEACEELEPGPCRRGHADRRRAAVARERANRPGVPRRRANSVGFNLGYFAVRGEDVRIDDDVLLANLDDLAFEIGDFSGFSFGGEWLYGFGDFIEAGVGVATTRKRFQACTATSWTSTAPRFCRT